MVLYSLRLSRILFFTYLIERPKPSLCIIMHHYAFFLSLFLAWATQPLVHQKCKSQIIKFKKVVSLPKPEVCCSTFEPQTRQNSSSGQRGCQVSCLACVVNYQRDRSRDSSASSQYCGISKKKNMMTCALCVKLNKRCSNSQVHTQEHMALLSAANWTPLRRWRAHWTNYYPSWRTLSILSTKSLTDSRAPSPADFSRSETHSCQRPSHCPILHCRSSWYLHGFMYLLIYSSCQAQ